MSKKQIWKLKTDKSYDNEYTVNLYKIIIHAILKIRGPLKLNEHTVNKTFAKCYGYGLSKECSEQLQELLYNYIHAYDEFINLSPKALNIVLDAMVNNGMYLGQHGARDEYPTIRKIAIQEGLMTAEQSGWINAEHKLHAIRCNKYKMVNRELVSV